MHIPYSEALGIHPQDAVFLEREVWDLENTPREQRPLLLHFHPLVIYRYQVLKQADVVLALFLQGNHFTDAEKLADFEYYDPLTTGDSTLSAVVQSILAAEVGYQDLALEYFRESIFVDLGDLHHNAADGVHVASAGGVWTALVSGFGGMRDHFGDLSVRPAAARRLAVAVVHAALARHRAEGHDHRRRPHRRRRTRGPGALRGARHRVHRARRRDRRRAAERPGSCPEGPSHPRSDRRVAARGRLDALGVGPDLDEHVGDSGGHRSVSIDASYNAEFDAAFGDDGDTAGRFVACRVAGCGARAGCARRP